MKITDVRATRVTVPFARFGKLEAEATWYTTRAASHCIVLFIDTDEGVTGVGEEGHFVDYDAVVNRIRPLLIGQDPFNVEMIQRDKRDGGAGVTIRRFGTSNVSLVDQCLWDIIGKVCNQPVHRLWGGKIRDPIYMRYWLSTETPKEMASEAVKAVEMGYKSFKIKIGSDPDLDLERAKAIREAVGDKIELNFDINGGYTLSRALRILPKFMKYVDPASIEEPISSYWPYDHGCIEALADLRRIVGVPLEVHCHNPNIEEFLRLLIEKRAVDTYHTHPRHMGGMLQCKRICAMAWGGGMKVTGQSSAAELGPSLSNYLQWIATAPECIGTNDCSRQFLEPPSWDIVKEDFRVVDGTLKVPEGPGLGVTIDPEKLKKSEELHKAGAYATTKGLGRSNTYFWG